MLIVDDIVSAERYEQLTHDSTVNILDQNLCFDPENEDYGKIWVRYEQH